jgi:hypothetical protein
LLVGSDEEDVRPAPHGHSGFSPAAFTIAGQRATSARMNSP